MPYTDNEVREILALAIDLTQGNYSAGAHDRFQELTGQSIGDARATSQFEHIVIFAFDPASSQVTRRQLVSATLPNMDEIFKAFVVREENHGKAVEMWGARWGWKEPTSYSCLKSAGRPTNAPVARLAHEALASLLAEDAEFEPNEFQKAAIASYGDGDYVHLLGIKGRTAFYQAVAEVSDTLFRFAMIELDTKEGLDGQDDAVRRMERASEEMNDLAAAVGKIPDAGRTI